MEMVDSTWREGIEDRRKAIEEMTNEERMQWSAMVLDIDVDRLSVVINKIAPNVAPPEAQSLVTSASFTLSQWDEADEAEKMGVLDLAEVTLLAVANHAVIKAVDEASRDDYDPPGYL